MMKSTLLAFAQTNRPPKYLSCGYTLCTQPSALCMEEMKNQSCYNQFKQRKALVILMDISPSTTIPKKKKIYINMINGKR